MSNTLSFPIFSFSSFFKLLVGTAINSGFLNLEDLIKLIYSVVFPIPVCEFGFLYFLEPFSMHGILV